jgi:hypothetical protein
MYTIYFTIEYIIYTIYFEYYILFYVVYFLYNIYIHILYCFFIYCTSNIVYLLYIYYIYVILFILCYIFITLYNLILYQYIIIIYNALYYYILFYILYFIYHIFLLHYIFIYILYVLFCIYIYSYIYPDTVFWRLGNILGGFNLHTSSTLQVFAPHQRFLVGVAWAYRSGLRQKWRGLLKWCTPKSPEASILEWSNFGWFGGTITSSNQWNLWFE